VHNPVEPLLKRVVQRGVQLNVLVDMVSVIESMEKKVCYTTSTDCGSVYCSKSYWENKKGD